MDPTWPAWRSTDDVAAAGAMADPSLPPPPCFRPHGFQGPHYVPQQQPQFALPFQDPRSQFPGGMTRPPPPPLQQQQQQMMMHGYPGSRQAGGSYAGYVPWGPQGFAPVQRFVPTQFRPPLYGHPPPGPQMSQWARGFGLQSWEGPQGSLRPPGNLPPTAAACSSAATGNGQLLIELPDLGHAGLGNADEDASGGQSHSDRDVDLKDVVAEVQKSIERAEKVLSQALKVVGLESAAQLPCMVTCPSDPQHRMPPGLLFEHIFRCPSSPLSFMQDGSSLLSKLKYTGREQATLDLTDGETSSDPASGKHRILDLWGGHYLYDDAPAVVRAGQSDMLPGLTSSSIPLPDFLLSELEVEVLDCLGDAEEESTRQIRSNDQEDAYLLPSSLWALKKEVGGWKDFPKAYSAPVHKALLCLHGVKCGDIIQWLLMNSPYYGLVLDMDMVRHISRLVVVCFRALHRESRGLPLPGQGIQYSQDLHSDMFEAAGNWLASLLEIVYSKASAKSITLGVFSRAVICSGCKLASSYFRLSGGVAKEDPLSLQSDQETPVAMDVVKTYAGNCSECDEGVENKPLAQRTASHFQNDTLEAVQAGNVSIDDEERRSILEGTVRRPMVVAAVSALEERAGLERTLMALMKDKDNSRAQLLLEYDGIVNCAAAERLKRPFIRPVLQHDGLIWNRNQQQDPKKRKTKEELLAEERDYKRRRMSYKGKKVRRTPTQVLRDIIDGHMQEIMDVGGIGCFVKNGVVSSPSSSLKELAGVVNAELVVQHEPWAESLTQKPTDSRSYRDRSFSHRVQQELKTETLTQEPINSRPHRDRSFSQRFQQGPEAETVTKEPDSRPHRDRPSSQRVQPESKAETLTQDLNESRPHRDRRSSQRAQQEPKSETSTQEPIGSRPHRNRSFSLCSRHDTGKYMARTVETGDGDLGHQKSRHDKQSRSRDGTAHDLSRFENYESSSRQRTEKTRRPEQQGRRSPGRSSHHLRDDNSVRREDRWEGTVDRELDSTYYQSRYSSHYKSREWIKQEQD